VADPVYAPVVRVALGLFRALDVRFDVAGLEHVPTSEGAVVVLNHTGYLDFALAGVPFWRAHRRLVRFMAKQEVFDNQVSGPLMRGMKHIPVDRSAGAAAYSAAVAALRRGELVGVFPEATISQSFELKDFKSGAARMAQEAGVPLLPVVLWGSQRIWTKGRPRALLRAGRHKAIAITVGAPLQVGAEEDVAEVTRRLVTVMTSLLVSTRARYGDRPASDADRWWVPTAQGGSAPTPEQAAALDAAEAEAKAAARAARATGHPGTARR